ncbi:MAG: hypothetical protein JW863_04405 [Chitinispirillaceae bacterium]|nr:hypothetical protein [Chitinispirillaceae bacterium]
MIKRCVSLTCLGIMLCTGLTHLCCTSDNTIGNIGSTQKEYDTLTVRDTITIRDTILDTLFADTLYDTLGEGDTVWVIAERETDMLSIGLVFDVSQEFGTVDTPFDSVYLSMFAISNPIREDLAVSVNGARLSPVTEHALNTAYGFSGFYVGYADMLAAFERAIFEDYVPKTDSVASYTFSVIKPVYPTGPGEDTTYDTLVDRVTLPEIVDSFVLANADSVYPADHDSMGIPTEYYITINTDLNVSWPGGADWYIVEVNKLWHDMLYGGIYYVGDPISMTLADTQFVVKKSFLFQDSTTPYEDTYNLIGLSVVPVNGPLPTGGRHFPSFDSSGVLIGMSTLTAALAIPDVAPMPLAKRHAGAARAFLKKRSALDVAARCLGTE